jgi:hypothetical protein
MKFDLSYIQTPQKKASLPFFPFSYFRRLIKGESEAKTAKELLADYRKNQLHLLKGEKLRFKVDGNIDVYNVTAPFKLNGKTYLAGRLDKHQEFLESLVTFFTPSKDGVWEVVKDAPTFKLEDPAVVTIHGQLIFSGIKVLDKKSNPVKFLTVFYRGRNLSDLHQFAQGPMQMKDIRLVELKDGRIGVFTRPQGQIGGLGTIGFTVLDSLSQLNADNLMRAKLFSNQFAPQHWGGANQIQVLEDGNLGVLSHYAFADKDEKGNYRRNYYATAFKYDPDHDKVSPLKIVATRSNFPGGPAKTDDLQNVIFSGGLERDGKGKAVLYGGLSDSEAGRITIPDPFI